MNTSAGAPRTQRGHDASDATGGEGLVALVTGASGGIGLAVTERLLEDENYAHIYACCRNPEGAFALRDLAGSHARLTTIAMDVTDTESVKNAATVIGRETRLDLVFNTCGILHSDDGMAPEKRVADARPEHLLRAYDVNAVGTVRLAAAFESLLRGSSAPRFASLSARVGSIADNRLGGWYAYRASKAALNMLIKTLAIEWARKMPQLVCIALHPGTVDSALSRPFTEGRKGKIFTPREAAANLLGVLAGLGPGHSGGFFAWDGEEIPW